MSVQLQAAVVRQTPKARHESAEERTREKRRTREQWEQCDVQRLPIVLALGVLRPTNTSVFTHKFTDTHSHIFMESYAHGNGTFFSLAFGSYIKRANYNTYNRYKLEHEKGS